MTIFFPNEVLNIIFSFRGPHPVAVLLTPLFENWREKGVQLKSYRNHFYKVHLDTKKSVQIHNRQLINNRLWVATKGRLDVVLNQPTNRYESLCYEHKTTDPYVIAVKDVYKHAPRNTKTKKIAFKYI